METKVCTKCNQPKPIDAFSKRSRDGREFYDSRCKQCASDHVKAYNRDHAKDAGRRVWESTLRNQFGTSPERYRLCLEKQGGVCAICGQPPGARTLTNRKIIHLHVDHDHVCCPDKKSCGKCLRGLLCGPCNQFLGLMDESYGGLERLAGYLNGKRLVVDENLEPLVRPPYIHKPRKTAPRIEDASDGAPSKICTTCKRPKPVPDGFQKCSSANDGLQYMCKDCFRDYQRENAESRYLLNLPSRLMAYGISLETYEKMEKIQRGRCLICQGGFYRRLDVDHDHTTAQVRGLLCNKCNQALGLINDDPKLAIQAVEYLKGPRLLVGGDVQTAFQKRTGKNGQNLVQDYECPDCGTRFEQVKKGVYGGHRRYCLHYRNL